MQKNNYLDLTNNEWKQNYLIGLPIYTIPLKLAQKVKIGTLFTFLVILPFSPITVPAFYKYLERGF